MFAAATNAALLPAAFVDVVKTLTFLLAALESNPEVFPFPWPETRRLVPSRDAF